MKTSDLNDEELREYFNEHVRYEIQMLFNAAWAISNKLPIQQGLEFMIVEAYAIHLRNLIDFFHPTNLREDDVCAMNYYREGETWEVIKPPLSDLLARARTRAHKEVSHLTTTRQFGVPKGKEWDIKGFTAEIVPLIRTFSESADRIDLQGNCSDLLLMYHKIEPHLI